MMTTFRQLASLLGAAGLLAGCAVSTPFKTVNAPADGDGRVIVVTHATVKPEQRALFDAQTRRVVASLGQQTALIGYSLRIELFGDEVWTLTAWRDEAARAAFFASPVHAEAMAAGIPALREARFLRIDWPAGSPRPSWPTLLQRLNREGRRYMPGGSG